MKECIGCKQMTEIMGRKFRCGECEVKFALALISGFEKLEKEDTLTVDALLEKGGL